jgi:hypothetical protein
MNPLLPELPEEVGIILTRKHSVEWCHEVDKVFSTFVTQIGELKARPELDGKIDTCFSLRFNELIEDLWVSVIGHGVSSYDCDLGEEVPLEGLKVPDDSLLKKALACLQNESATASLGVPMASTEKRKSCEGPELSLGNPLVDNFLSASSQGVNVTPSKIFRGEKDSKTNLEGGENVKSRDFAEDLAERE